MSATIVRLPRPFRHPLPADATPWENRHVLVFPHAGRWSWAEYDDNGGGNENGLTKLEALRIALNYVVEDNATCEILGHDWFTVQL